MINVPWCVLDLSPVAAGTSAGQALRHTTAAAQRAEELGCHRFWVAEHHNMPAIASSAPAVLLAHLAAATSTIRVGSGGVMLPNHAPLVVAEQFGTLEALHPELMVTAQVYDIEVRARSLELIAEKVADGLRRLAG